MLCKYLNPLKLHRNGFVFKICVWISVFRVKKLFKNPIFGCRDIRQKPSLIFFGTPCIYTIHTSNLGLCQVVAILISCSRNGDLIFIFISPLGPSLQSELLNKEIKMTSQCGSIAALTNRAIVQGYFLPRYVLHPSKNHKAPGHQSIGPPSIFRKFRLPFM